MMLKNKVTVIHGAGGAVGSAVARAFAREGARLFLAGRRRAPVEAVAAGIVAAGGLAEAAEVDALDERAIEGHLQTVVEGAGRLDIAFNAVGLRNTRLQGVPLLDLEPEDFARPIETYARSCFLTSRSAARRMVTQGAGVILTITSTPSRAGIPLMGGVGPAMAAVEQLTRNLSAELAPKGVRVLGLRPTGMPDSDTIQEVFGLHARAWGIPWEQFRDLIASRSHGKRLTTLAEMASVAAFMASDQASGMTGSILNLSLGALDD